VVLGTVLVGALAACGDTEPTAGDTTSTTSSASATATGSPSATGTATASTTPATPGAATLKATPVYWVAESRQSFALYREFRSVPDVGGPVASAVAAMTRMKPLDPDYVTPWRPASRVAVTQRGQALAVDLSRDAFSNTNVGSELASRALQQLVYTATAAAQKAGTPASTVTVTADGAAYDAWGVVRVGEPMRRAPMLEVQAHAWVTSPQEGETRPAGTVRFTGYGTSFEANFTWQVRTPSGAVRAKGFATGGTGTGGFGPFAFSAKLAPGTYVVEVSTDDPSGGAEGRGPATDTKTFVVR
jgi:hypothetical protein